MRTWQRPRPARSPFLGLVALITLLVPLTASAEWIDLGGDVPLEVQLLSSDETSSVYAITVGGFEATPVKVDDDTWYEITLPGAPQALVFGYPSLPMVRRALAIPDDRAVVANIIESEHVDLPDLPVAPSKGNLLRSVDPATVAYQFDAFYQTSGLWPERVVEADAPHIVRDLRGVVVQANPFQFLPGSDVLRVHTRIVVEVRDAGPGQINVLERQRPFTTVDSQFARLYESHFLNHDALRYDTVEETGGLLIISDDAFAGAMQPLVEWKLQKGLDTRLVTLTDTGSSFSQIKSYIAGELADWAPAYVLLVGDIAQIPIGSDSDPEYSTLLGSDSYPDLFVGRFSAENANHVATQVQRTITYERDIAAGPDWMQYGVGIASAEGPGDDGEYDNVHEDVIRNKLLDYGYLGVDRIYDPGASASAVTTALNAGRGIVNYTGHGSSTAWSTTGFSNTSVNALVNGDQLPFICSVACNNGTFTGTCFAEAWLRATDGGTPTGAVATYMSYISQSWNPPMCGQDAAVDLLVADEMRTIGGLWFNGSCQMMDEYGAAGANEFLNWTIFGDPSLAVRTKAAAPLVADHDGAMLIGMNQYTVNCDAPGARCALYADGVLYGTALADDTGLATIVLQEPLTVPVTLTLTVTAYNRATVQDEVTVVPPDGPYLVYAANSVLDDDGDQDGVLDIGETVGLDVLLENVGVAVAAGLTATLASDDPYLEIVGPTASYPDIPAGETGSGSTPFAVTVLGGAPDGYQAPLTLMVTGPGDQWDMAFSLPIQAPQLAVAVDRIQDIPGDYSGTADPGETCSLTLMLANTGAAGATDLAAVLDSASPHVSILMGSATCAQVDAGGQATLTPLQVEVLESCPSPSLLVFDLTVTSAEGHLAALQFELAVGGWFDDLESDRGWTVGAADDDASAGIWLRADPVGTSYDGAVVQMEDDHTPDPGVQCFVTGNATPGQSAGTADVDGGKTTLLTPVFALADATAATVHYWRWYTNDLGNSPGEDWWEVSVTNNGVDWIQLEYTQESSEMWQQFTFDLMEYVALTDQIQLRFVASDEGGGSLVEAGVDDFHLEVRYDLTTAVDDRADLPTALSLEGCYPNPFNPATRIVFSLPRDREVDLAVYDVSGRRVATLVHGSLLAGRHEVLWQGRDDRGGLVASGVYFSRLVSEGEMQTRKMLLLK